ncbi:MAG: DUF3667 domain-containing protein [Balneolaceae bacterium]|nr:DUF3667 domain-containing protein [Balneolaceae bacterium]MBO6545445.1 DUF3667 domain-containing protein [Balneolaceae bacterium]MBO6646841.1 DUF3667 domain-containing protein [Balneolaceae bacterium]
MSNSVIQKEGTCLNCGTDVRGNYCSNCGQKFQPTKLPLKQFLEDAIETLFTIDNRFFRTIKDLFLKPGKVTKEYLIGKRAKYLPPLRVYISISVVYFLIAQLIESDKILFVNFTQDGDSRINLAKIVQTAMFFLVPVMAAILKFLHLKRKAYYVEHLIFSVHIHSVWFVFFTIQLLLMSLGSIFEGQASPSLVSIIDTIEDLPQLAALIFFMIYMKNVFEEPWFKVIVKGVFTIMLYLTTLALVTLLATWF